MAYLWPYRMQANSILVILSDALLPNDTHLPIIGVLVPLMNFHVERCGDEAHFRRNLVQIPFTSYRLGTIEHTSVVCIAIGETQTSSTVPRNLFDYSFSVIELGEDLFVGEGSRVLMRLYKV